LQNVAVISDSLSCIPRQLIDRYGIVIVPIRIIVQGKVYRDMVDITPSEAYELFLKNSDQFSTSPSSPGQYIEAYRESAKFARSILCVTVSARISTAYNVARLARDQAKSHSPDLDIVVLDSQTVTASEGFIALAAAKVAAEGEELGEVVKAAERVREKVSFFAFLDTVKHVYRTGRAPKIAADVASMLDIKPILTTSAGAVRLKTIARNREQGENRLLEIMRARVGDAPVHVAVMHAYAPERAERLKQRVSCAFDCVELLVCEFSPVMGYATGTDALGLAFYAEEA